MQTPRLDMRGHLLCAVCGDDYTHLRGVNSYQGDDVTRQDANLIFECENGGHIFEVTFHQHKGNTEVTAEGRTIEGLRRAFGLDA